jgi:hypothetical protein
MCPGSAIYTLMVYGQVFFYLLVFVLLDHFNGYLKKAISVIAIICTGMTILNYSYQINGGYANLYYAEHQAENYFSCLITQVKQTPGFSTDKKWVFIGDRIQDPLYENPWAVPEFCYGGVGENLLNVWSRAEFIEQFLGYRIPFADKSDIDKIVSSGRVDNLKQYPNSGSILITEEYIIICLNEAYGQDK